MAKKVRDSLLDEVFIASPCTVSWDSMEGDHRTRNCSSCSKNVYNLSEMTRKEAEEFISLNGDSQCLTFYRRFDGTILTDDCPVGLRKIRDRVKLATRVAASVVAFLVSLPGAIAQSVQTKDTKPIKQQIKKTRDTRLMGKVHPMRTGGIMAPPGSIPTPVNPPKTEKKQDAEVKQPVHFIDVPKTKDQKGLAETKAVNLHKKAQKAISAGNIKLGEFYLEKAIDAFDQQKANGDKAYRQKLVRELSNLRVLNKLNP